MIPGLDHSGWPNGKPVTQEHLDGLNKMRDSALRLSWANAHHPSISDDAARRAYERMLEIIDSLYFDHDLIPGQETL